MDTLLPFAPEPRWILYLFADSIVFLYAGFVKLDPFSKNNIIFDLFVSFLRNGVIFKYCMKSITWLLSVQDLLDFMADFMAVFDPSMPSRGCFGGIQEMDHGLFQTETGSLQIDVGVYAAFIASMCLSLAVLDFVLFNLLSMIVSVLMIIFVEERKPFFSFCTRRPSKPSEHIS